MGTILNFLTGRKTYVIAVIAAATAAAQALGYGAGMAVRAGKCTAARGRQQELSRGVAGNSQSAAPRDHWRCRLATEPPARRSPLCGISAG
jgi:hypothetical protein